MNEGGGGDRSSRSTSPETEVTKSRDEISNSSSTNGDSAKKQKSVKRYFLVYYYGHSAELHNRCNGTDWTGSLACLFLFSVNFQTRPSTSVWNSPFIHFCSQIKRLWHLWELKLWRHITINSLHLRNHIKLCSDFKSVLRWVLALTNQSHLGFRVRPQGSLYAIKKPCLPLLNNK